MVQQEQAGLGRNTDLHLLCEFESPTVLKFLLGQKHPHVALKFSVMRFRQPAMERKEQLQKLRSIRAGTEPTSICSFAVLCLITSSPVPPANVLRQRLRHQVETAPILSCVAGLPIQSKPGKVFAEAVGVVLHFALLAGDAKESPAGVGEGLGFPADADHECQLSSVK